MYSRQLIPGYNKKAISGGTKGNYFNTLFNTYVGVFIINTGKRKDNRSIN